MKVVFARQQQRTLPRTTFQDTKIELTSTTDEESDRSSPYLIEEYVKSFAAFSHDDEYEEENVWEANFDEPIVPIPFPDDIDFSMKPNLVALSWSGAPSGAPTTNTPLKEHAIDQNQESFFVHPVSPDDDRDDIHLLKPKKKQTLLSTKRNIFTSRKKKHHIPEHQASLLSSEHDFSPFEKNTGYDVDILEEIPEEDQHSDAWELEKLKLEGEAAHDHNAAWYGFPIVVDDETSTFEAPRTTLKDRREIHRAIGPLEFHLDCELSTIDEATIEDDCTTLASADGYDSRVTINSSQSTVSFTVDFFSQPNFLNLSQDSSILLDRDWAVPVDPNDVHEV